MGKSSRDKGARGERELASLLPGALKVSGMYRPGPDIIWLDREVEVKRRREGFKFDYRNLENAQLLFKRADRADWLVTMRLDTLLDLLDL